MYILLVIYINGKNKYGMYQKYLESEASRWGF